MIAGELGHQLRKHARGVSTMKHPIYATLRDVYIMSSFRTYVPSESIDRNRALSKFGLPENLIIFCHRHLWTMKSLFQQLPAPRITISFSFSFLSKRIIVRGKRNSQKFEVLHELHKYTNEHTLNYGDEVIRIYKKRKFEKSNTEFFFLVKVDLVM